MQFEFILSQDKLSVPLGDDRQVVLVKGFKSIKPAIDTADVPEHFIELTLSRKALDAHFKVHGEFDQAIFTYQDSYNVKPKKCDPRDVAIFVTYAG